MKDGILLLIAGVAFAAFAWAFWHYLGDDALTVLLAVSLIASIVDNRSLRRKLKAIETGKNTAHL